MAATLSCRGSRGAATQATQGGRSGPRRMGLVHRRRERSGRAEAPASTWSRPFTRGRPSLAPASSAGNEAAQGLPGVSTAPSLEEGLKQLDRYLQANEDAPGVRDEAMAIAMMDKLKESRVAPGFGGADQVPKRAYTLDELRLNKIYPEALLSPQDKTLNGIRDQLTFAAAAGIAAFAYGNHWGSSMWLGAAVAVLAGMTADQVAAGGGISALVLDTFGRLISPTYKGRVAAHEAGHFLIAYLLGMLPQAYTLSALEAYQRYKAFNIQAGTVFCDSDFQKEIATGRITSSTLDRYTCVALAGVATEYLQYGVAEGGLGDVQQLDSLLRALGFTQAKADSQVRWAVLNTIILLRRHENVHMELADAMLRGVSVGEAIAIIEEGLRKETALNH